MAVAWVAGSTVQFVTDATLTVAAPTGIADDDTLLAAVFGRSALTTPSGWTKLLETSEFTNGSFFQRMAVFSKDTVTTADSGANFTFEQVDVARFGVLYAVARGVDSVLSYQSTINSTATNEITPTTVTADIDGTLLVVFASVIVTDAGAYAPVPPTSFTLFSGSSLTLYRLAGAYRAVDDGQSNSGAFTMLAGVGTNGLGAIILRLRPSAAPSAIDAISSAPGPLGVVAALGVHSTAGRAAVASPLGATLAFSVHDFTAAFARQSLLYVMDLTTPSGTVRVPISSWQATLQTEQQNYAQCVVPACLPYVEQINAATAFSVSRRAALADGTAFEYEMAAAPLDNASMAQGTANYSATLSGYSTGFVVDAAPPEATSRILAGVRTIFTQPSGIRVRCAIDWLLRPAQIAYVEGTPFIVSYINYYVSDGDQYMDVGERVEPA